MTKMNIRFTNDGIRNTENDERIDISSIVKHEIGPEPDITYTIDTKWVGSSFVLSVDGSGVISYRQLKMYIQRLYRKSKLLPFFNDMTDLLSSTDISSFEQRLYDVQNNDPTFSTVKTYILTIIAYYRSGGTDMAYLNVMTLGEMKRLIPILNELTFAESFLSTNDMGSSRSRTMIDIIVETYRDIHGMKHDDIHDFIRANDKHIRSRIASFYHDRIFDD